MVIIIGLETTNSGQVQDLNPELSGISRQVLYLFTRSNNKKSLKIIYKAVDCCQLTVITK